jgi:hypothetical protein
LAQHPQPSSVPLLDSHPMETGRIFPALCRQSGLGKGGRPRTHGRAAQYLHRHTGHQPHGSHRSGIFFPERTARDMAIAGFLCGPGLSLGKDAPVCRDTGRSGCPGRRRHGENQCNCGGTSQQAINHPTPRKGHGVLGLLARFQRHVLRIL